jgi:hypothetical protein
VRNELADQPTERKDQYYRNITIEDNLIYNGHYFGITVGADQWPDDQFGNSVQGILAGFELSGFPYTPDQIAEDLKFLPQ